VAALLALVEKEKDALCRGGSGRLLPLFDAFVPQLTYANSKVNLAALQALEQMIPLLRDHLALVATNLIPALASCLASSNMQVRSLTPSVLDTLMLHVDGAALVHPCANCTLYASPKARASMIERLVQLAVTLYPAKPHLVTKHVVPVGFRLLDDNRTELRSHTAQLLRTLHNLLGNGLFEAAQKQPVSTQQRLSEIVQAL